MQMRKKACGMQMRKKRRHADVKKKAQGQNGHFKSKYRYFL
jgi:hypothetical protein